MERVFLEQRPRLGLFFFASDSIFNSMVATSATANRSSSCSRRPVARRCGSERSFLEQRPRHWLSNKNPILIPTVDVPIKTIIIDNHEELEKKSVYCERKCRFGCLAVFCFTLAGKGGGGGGGVCHPVVSGVGASRRRPGLPARPASNAASTGPSAAPTGRTRPAANL